MTLKELIDTLGKYDQSRLVKRGFIGAHSYRGDYAQVAFQPVVSVSIANMLASAKLAIGHTYTGWKGGEYTMTEDTNVYIARIGECGDEITHDSLAKMLDDYVGKNEPIEATDVLYSLPVKIVKDIKHALESGLEYSRECLQTHEIALGRTTLKNKRLAEMMETDIKHSESTLKKINQYLDGFAG